MFNKHQKLLSSSLSSPSLLQGPLLEAGPPPAPAAASPGSPAPRTLDGAGHALARELLKGGWHQEGDPVMGHRPHPQAGLAACPHGPGREGGTETVALASGTHPRPRQPSLRLTSLCSSPSNRERSSGEKESGSSTACREERTLAGAEEESWPPAERETVPSFLTHPSRHVCSDNTGMGSLWGRRPE